MTKFTALTLIPDEDLPYIKEALDGSRFKLMEMKDQLYVLCYGDEKNKSMIENHIESELISLGIHAIHTEVYLELAHFK